MEYVEISAKTLDDAITKACIQLGISSDNLEYKVISEGSSGFLGIGSKPAIIKAHIAEAEQKLVELAAVNDAKPALEVAR